MLSPLRWIVLFAVAGCTAQNLPPQRDPQVSPVVQPQDSHALIASASKRDGDQTTLQIDSLSASKATAAELRNSVQDPVAERSARASAVFALFANQLKLPCGAPKAQEALGSSSWLTAVKFFRIDGVAGFLPVNLSADSTTFCMHVCPMENGWSDWLIYLVLSGHRSEDDLRAFFRGEMQLENNPKLMEFALCYPNGYDTFKGRRIEHFEPKGMQVREW